MEKKNINYGYVVVNAPSTTPHPPVPSSSPPPPVPVASPPPPMNVSAADQNVHVTYGIPVHTDDKLQHPHPSPPQRLRCGGLGVGWFLFILGWFIAIPWYVGAFTLWCTKIDPREKPGYIACTILAIINTACVIYLIVRITQEKHDYDTNYGY